MRRFHYNGIAKVEIEDRALAHLQVVIGQKLRRGESFFFSWNEDASVGDGRSSVWLHPDANLHFRYHGSRRPELSRAWLEALTVVANSNTGLYLIPEPAPHEGGTVPPDLEE